jgi:adenylate kinase family enzyme
MKAAQRVLAYGVTGSGKSTCATRIASALDLPLTLVDDLTWEPGWVEVPKDVQRERISVIVAGDRWVLDTAYGSWRDVVLPRAELLVGLDYPRWLSLGRLLRRSVVRSIDKQVICNGNTESFRLLLRRDSIIAWHFNSFATKRARMRAWAESDDGPDVLLFSRPRDLDAWLETLSPDK